jgi:hypothetical protein
MRPRAHAAWKRGRRRLTTRGDAAEVLKPHESHRTAPVHHAATLQCCTTTTIAEECAGWCGVLYVNMSARLHGNHVGHRHTHGQSHGGGQRFSSHTLQTCHPDQSDNRSKRRRRQSRESVYLRRAQPNSQPGSERGRFGVALAWWAPGTSQSSDERPALALLSRKLDYTAADPPKLRPGLVSARQSPFARNGARPSECLLFTPIPSRPDCFVFLLCTRLTRFPTPTLVTVSS